MTFLIAVIGAGVVGTLIARELIKYEKDVAIFDEKSGPGRMVSKANSGIIHGGYDDTPNTLRAKLSYKGNKMYDELSKDLSFDLKRCGSHVVAFEEEDLEYINSLVEKAIKNGVEEYQIIKGETLKKMEPKVNEDIIASFYCPIAGIVNPWMVAHQAARNVEMNGGKLYFNKKLIDVEMNDKRYLLKFEDDFEFEADIVINAAGLYADEIAKLFGDEVPKIYPVKGEYYLTKPEFKYVNSIIFPIPNKISKGCLVVPVIDGGFLIGPNAQEIRDKKDFSNTNEGLSEIREKGLKLVPEINYRQDSVKTFAGLRPETAEKDFYIGKGEGNVVHVSGIRSPGLTAAPAIAQYVVDEIIKKEMNTKFLKRQDFNPKVDSFRVFNEEDIDLWNERIENDPEAGELVCFCNKVSKKDIKAAIKKGAKTLEDIKFLTGASFGECQGSYCSSKIVKILAEELNKKPEDIVMNEKGTWIIDSEVRL
ncbi:FAD-dependent oxidoreductase [Oceanotoga teriensis]|uniref:FAD-dependent oxidoreductase n=1 Tax=Oceanotoga teriensis TaxID=515440 RepID=UPI001F0BB11F|nr:FAD-dependent oxidoreductase [Oceanotoga teriensis]MDO7976063.1 FAD-dependent oxidoreductase [Oceanotoga teriensis]